MYVIDQPRRGDAGRSTVSTTISATPDEQMWFNMFRIGTWPDYFDGVQFSRDPEALNQFFRSMTPNTGPFDMEVVSSAVSALVDKLGGAVLFTHSQGFCERICLEIFSVATISISKAGRSPPSRHWRRSRDWNPS